MDNFSAMARSHDNRLERAEMDRLDRMDSEHETDIAAARMEIDSVLDQLKVDLEEVYPEYQKKKTVKETIGTSFLQEQEIYEAGLKAS